ncbi:hypothetical protein PybrP1_005434 [[Pythium] brassicae (nom. inval.)]|nr:hypothetical protein PybrP1_005434 [[Pythium] brassicae (nom. inval.)]
MSALTPCPWSYHTRVPATETEWISHQQHHSLLYYSGDRHASGERKSHCEEAHSPKMHAPPTSRPVAPVAAAPAPGALALVLAPQRRQHQQHQQHHQRPGIRLYDEPPPRPRAKTHGVRTNTSSAHAHAHTASSIAPHASSALLSDSAPAEVFFTSACVVDSRISYETDTRRFVEYKLAIESPTHGTLFAWRRYSVFLQLAATLELEDSDGARHEMPPRLPSKKIFGNFSDATISARVEKLNWFLAAAVGVEFREWGIRLDDGTCVYKRSSGGGGGRDSLTSNASTATAGSSPRQPRGSRRLSLKRFGFRRASTAE